MTFDSRTWQQEPLCPNPRLLVGHRRNGLVPGKRFHQCHSQNEGRGQGKPHSLVPTERFLETWKTVPEIRTCKTCSWEPCLGTCSWEPLLGNLLGTLLGNLFLRTLLGTSCWEPLLGNLFLVTLLGTSSWEPCLGTLLRNLAWEPVPGNLFLGTLLGNLFLGTLLGGTSWEPCLGTCSWEPCLGNCSEPGNPCLGFPWKRRPLPGNLVPNLARCGFGCSDLLRDLYYG